MALWADRGAREKRRDGTEQGDDGDAAEGVQRAIPG